MAGANLKICAAHLTCDARRGRIAQKEKEMNKELKKGVDILTGNRPLLTDDDLKCLELAATRYGIEFEDAVSFVLFFAGDDEDYDEN